MRQSSAFTESMGDGKMLINGNHYFNLNYMRKFAALLTDEGKAQALSALLSWSHNTYLFDKTPYRLFAVLQHTASLLCGNRTQKYGIQAGIRGQAKFLSLCGGRYAPARTRQPVDRNFALQREG
jgi:hypothetical protein